MTGVQTCALPIYQTMGCRMNGRYGNFGIILPERNAVVAVVGREEKDQQRILDCVWEEILPQL